MLSYKKLYNVILRAEKGETYNSIKNKYSLGFLEETDVPELLRTLDLCGAPFDMMHTSFFLSRQTLLPSEKPAMPLWREKIFAWLLRNSASFTMPSPVRPGGAGRGSACRGGAAP